MGIQVRRTKDGKPRYQARIDTIDPITGKRGHQTIGTFRTKREAEHAEAEAKIKQARGTLLVPEKTTVGELLDRWLETEVPRTVRPENIPVYEIVIRKHLKPALGHIQVQKLRAEHIERFYTELHTAGKSTSLIKKRHMRLSSALNMAKRFGLVAENVCEIVKPPKVSYRKAEVWTASDTLAFLEVAAQDGLHPYWSLAVETGARTSELLGITWEDVDFERGRIVLGHRVVRLLRGTPIIKHDAKTAAGRRTVGITPEMVELLSRYQVEWNERRLRASVWDNPYGLVFCTASGRPTNPAHVRRSFNRLIDKAGVKRITPHEIRKTHITALVAGGANLKGVAVRVGHRDVTTTLQTYAQLVPQMEEEVLEVVGRITPRPKGQRAS